MDEEYNYITLLCRECENTECNICRKYIPEDSKEGCTRKVSELLYVKYIHLLQEVAPFMYIDTSKSYQDRTYNEIISFLTDEIYTSPIGNKLGKLGKPVKFS